MLIKNGAIIMEQCQDPEGNRGDSCSESGRYSLLCNYTGLKSEINMSQFCVPNGYLRHPDLFNTWGGVKDFSTDQAIPYFLSSGMAERAEMLCRIKANGWKTGNGDYVSPAFFAELKNSQILRVICLLGQMAIFAFPMRWSDSDDSFEWSNGSSADWLNFFHVAMLAPKWVRRLVNKENLSAKIHQYYAIEPNSKWLLDLYDKAIEKL